MDPQEQVKYLCPNSHGKEWSIDTGHLRAHSGMLTSTYYLGCRLYHRGNEEHLLPCL